MLKRLPEKSHGPVRVYNTFHFAYADGTPYYPFGTTCYASIHQGDALEEQTLETLNEAAFQQAAYVRVSQALPLQSQRTGLLSL